jgi:hypothetical protein
MIRVLCLLTTLMMSCLLAEAQDFASRFMQECKNDTAVHCITISPKMMGRMMKSSSGDSYMYDIISKLKSTRIVETAHHIEKYYLKAERLIARNSARFSALNKANGSESHALYVRKKDDLIVELVMIHKKPHESLFQIIDFTGNMDDQFIAKLSKSM